MYPLGIVTFAPVPWVNVTASPAEFFTIHTLERVFGANVTVQACERDPVRVRARERKASLVPSAIVIVPVLASERASLAAPNFSAISSKFVFVVVPHVPEPSPVAISLSRKSFTYVLAILCYLFPIWCLTIINRCPIRRLAVINS